MRIGCTISRPDCRDNGTWSHIRHVMIREMGIDVQWTYRGDPVAEDCDFYFFCDDGLDDIPMECPRPNACYLIDTHLGWDVRLGWAKHFDRVFCAQKGDTMRMRNEGHDAHWLPLACNPAAHPNQQELMALRQALEAQNTEEARAAILSIFMDTDLSKQWDAVFVGFMNKGVEGHPCSHNRLDYLDALFKALPNSWLTTNCFHEAMAARYVKGRVGFNVSILDDLNMRCFEIPSTGAAMLANSDVQGLDDLGFRDGENFVGYCGVEDAVGKAQWMLAHPEERETIAAAGHRLVREKHTYAHRVAEMLATCGIERISDGQNKESEEAEDGI